MNLHILIVSAFPALPLFHQQPYTCGERIQWPAPTVGIPAQKSLSGLLCLPHVGMEERGGRVDHLRGRIKHRAVSKVVQGCSPRADPESFTASSGSGTG